MFVHVFCDFGQHRGSLDLESHIFCILRCLEDSVATAPTVETHPEGPAFCCISDDIRAAVQRLWSRLHATILASV